MNKLPTKIFIAVEAAAYIAFTALDIAGKVNTSPIKFFAIALCFAFSAYLAAHGGERTVTYAVGFSMTADVFLLMLDSSYAVGVALFFVAQMFYFARIYRLNGRRSASFVRIIAFFAAITALLAMKAVSPLNVLAAAYFTFFACNAVQSFGVKNKLFTLGLCLFLCCDICVGLHNMPFALPRALKKAADIGMWTFYLPSQVLITLSGRIRDE